MLIVEDLMRSPLPLEPYEVNGLDPCPRSDGGDGIEPVDTNLFREEIQLRLHGGGR
jgi:hypothetical protein